MKTTEEKAIFRKHFLKLGQGHIIPTNETNDKYWNQFWQVPSCSGDIYDVISAKDVKKVRDQNLINIIQFIHKLCEKIINSDVTNEKGTIQLLNSVRFLNRLLPFIFELPTFLDDLELELFWNPEFNPITCLKDLQHRENITTEEDFELYKPTMKYDKIKNCLAVNLISKLVDLLFIENFTVSTGKPNARGQKVLHVWEPGIGNSSKFQPPNLIIDSNRSEVLKLLLTLCTTSFFQPVSKLTTNGSKFLTLLVAVTPKIELLTLVSSLLNISCRSSRSSPEENGLMFDKPEYSEIRHLCVTYSFQLLTLMIVYPLPQKSALKFLTESKLSPKPYNMARLYMGKIHKEGELLFIASSLINILRIPLMNARDQESDAFSMLKAGQGNARPSLWSLEAVMLIWELLQSNRNFVAIIGKRYIVDLMIILLYYVSTYHNQKQFKNLVFVCSYLLLYLSSIQDNGFMESLFTPFTSSKPMLEFYSSLPSSYKLSITPITPRDFLVSSICTLLINNPATRSSAANYLTNTQPLPDLLLKTMIEILYNLIPPIAANTTDVPNDRSKKLNNPNPRGGLSYQSSSLITSLIGALSKREFLLEKSFHADIVALLIRAICTAVVKYPTPSRMLLFSILKNEKTYDELWNTIFSFTGVFFRGNSLTTIEDKIDEQPSKTDVESTNSEDYFNGNHHNAQVQPIPIAANNNQIIGGDDNDHDDDPQPNSILSETESIEASLRPKLPSGMSVKAREKLKKDSPLGKTWAGNDALAVLLTIIIPHLKVILDEVWSRVQGSSVDSFELVERIASAHFDDVIEQNKSQIHYDLLPDTPLEQLKFNWNHLALGWYISLLYGQIYNSTEAVKVYSGTNSNNYKIVKNLTSKLTSNWSSFLKLDSSNTQLSNVSEDLEWVNNSLSNVNIFTDSDIKLFKVESATKDGFFANLNSKIINNYSQQNGNTTSPQQPYNHAVPSTPGSINDMTRRLNDFKFNNGSNVSLKSLSGSPLPSGLSTPVEEQEMFFQRRPYRNSVSSLHSLNTLNRTRSNSNTPRNSMS
ncbi:hypothetical protein G210_3029 [Candida maltosa Xu316]|uniref:Protein HID1 n=1 Tax=Candida maltosa (strain Xu316) TaxID=1245528 RepID=M3JUX6_CANMX|nr:hypothetical protein G210_3029 [Candida maltosa Xu316]